MATLTKTERKQWLKAVNLFKTRLPHTSMSVRVRVTRLIKADGNCQPPKDGCVTIYISSRLSYSERMEVLCHEWAHLLDDHWKENGDPHGPSWGRRYSKCYRLSEKTP